LHAGGLTELVGREEELELLLRRGAKAKTGEGQVGLLSCESGIGKTRLTASLMERLPPQPLPPLRYFSSPQHTDSALYPIMSQMERVAAADPSPRSNPMTDHQPGRRVRPAGLRHRGGAPGSSPSVASSSWSSSSWSWS